MTTGLASAAVMLLVGYPFGLVPISAADPVHSLWHRFLATSARQVGTTVNAFNVWMNPLFDVVRVGGRGITEGRWPADAYTLVTIAGIPVTWQVIGIVAFLAATLVALTVLVRRDDGYMVLFVALVIAVAFYVLPTRVHERYLYPALALAAPFVVCRGGWRAFYAAISTVFFLDLYWVYTLPMGFGLDRWRLLDGTVLSVPGIYALSAVMVLSLGWLLTRVPRPLALPFGLDFVWPQPPPRRIGARLVRHRA